MPHLHGGHNAQESDGYAEAWFLPPDNNIPGGFATHGTWYEFFKNEFRTKFGVEWEPGTATFQYQNDQRAGTFWYHDHTLGMTRLNVYAGPAGFYLLRRGPGDLPGVPPSMSEPARVKARSGIRLQRTHRLSHNSARKSELMSDHPKRAMNQALISPL